MFLEHTTLVLALGPLLLLSLYSDLYSNVNSFGKPVLIPQLKTVTLHPYYSLLHSNTLTLHYIFIGLAAQSMSSLIRHRLQEIESFVLFTASFPAPETMPGT